MGIMVDKLALEQTLFQEIRSFLPGIISPILHAQTSVRQAQSLRLPFDNTLKDD
jgi:hypothetical protein